MQDILQKLEGLKDEDVAKVLKLINKLSGKTKSTQQETPIVESRPKQTSRPAIRDVVRSGGATTQSRRASGTGTTSGATGKMTKLMRAEPMGTAPRENKLFEMIDKDPVVIRELEASKQHDQELESKIKRTKPVERERRSTELIWVACAGHCGNEYLVNPDLITSEYSFRCNDCIAK